MTYLPISENLDLLGWRAGQLCQAGNSWAGLSAEYSYFRSFQVQIKLPDPSAFDEP